MEPVTRLIERRPTAGRPAPAPGRPSELAPTLAVTATYLLSENGRKASLLMGGDGRALQHITLNIPANRLHLVSVDTEGVARLKLQPQFEPDASMHVIRNDAMPVYDAPPAHDELYRIAARNHEFELLYEAECQRARANRRDEERRTSDRAARDNRRPITALRPRAPLYPPAARAPRHQPGEIVQLAGVALRSLTPLR